MFQQFTHSTFQGVSVLPPISPPTLALFIAYMFDHHYAASTVNTYVSALGYFHKLSGFPDPTKVFFIIQMLKGYGKLGTRLDSRLPITLPILHKLLTAAEQFSLSRYTICQFQAMCSLAFHALLRVGEMSTAKKEAGPPLQLHQLAKLVSDKQEVVALRVTFLNYKHSYNQLPFSLVVNRQSSFCPVQILLVYLALRGNTPGPIFKTEQGATVERTSFTDLLSQAIKFSGLNPSRYKGHSFRIGAASHAAERGMSDAQIRILGRWKSNAFQKYIRVPSLSS